MSDHIIEWGHDNTDTDAIVVAHIVCVGRSPDSRLGLLLYTSGGQQYEYDYATQQERDEAYTRLVALLAQKLAGTESRSNIGDLAEKITRRIGV